MGMFFEERLKKEKIIKIYKITVILIIMVDLTLTKMLYGPDNNFRTLRRRAKELGFLTVYDMGDFKISPLGDAPFMSNAIVYFNSKTRTKVAIVFGVNENPNSYSLYRCNID